MPRRVIEIGEVFGRFTVLADTGKVRNFHKVYLCRCECGVEKEVRKGSLVNGGVLSCGCIVTDGGETKPILVGTSFGSLTVMGLGARRGKEFYYTCRCECGAELDVYKHNLLRGYTQSCGAGYHKKRTERLPIAPGTTFGKLTVISSFRKDIESNSGNAWYYTCLCSCGNETNVRRGNLTSGQVISCGCAVVDAAQSRTTDHTGERVGRLLLIELIRKNDEWTGRPAVWYRCVCDCGKEIVSKEVYLFRIAKPKQSCGCLHQEALHAPVTHGYYVTNPIEFGIWRAMIQRCESEKYKAYPYYGGRGIKVCDSWRESFASFLADIGPRPSKYHSIDRVDVNGNYEPSNARWATWEEQCNNKRSNVKLTHKGTTMTIAQWCRNLGIRENRVRRNLSKGLTPYEAVFLGYPRTKKRREKLGWAFR